MTLNCLPMENLIWETDYRCRVFIEEHWHAAFSILNVTWLLKEAQSLHMCNALGRVAIFRLLWLEEICFFVFVARDLILNVNVSERCRVCQDRQRLIGNFKLNMLRTVPVALRNGYSWWERIEWKVNLSSSHSVMSRARCKTPITRDLSSEWV